NRLRLSLTLAWQTATLFFPIPQSPCLVAELTRPAVLWIDRQCAIGHTCRFCIALEVKQGLGPVVPEPGIALVVDRCLFVTGQRVIPAVKRRKRQPFPIPRPRIMWVDLDCAFVGGQRLGMSIQTPQYLAEPCPHTRIGHGFVRSLLGSA